MLDLKCIKFDQFSSNNELMGVFNWEEDPQKDEIPVVDILVDYWGETDSEEEKRIILHIPLNLYMDIVYRYLRGKQEYCERYGHYCGVGGGFFVEDGELYNDVVYSTISGGEIDNYHFKSVNVYEFSSDPDFEHG